MDNQKLELKSISEILGMNFFIPSYQRGYRWGEQQVQKLLDDVWNFSQFKTKDEFYPLQPIVVFNDKSNYEVIDGQQRITTIYIILKYLQNLFNEIENNKKDIEKIKTILPNQAALLLSNEEPFEIFSLITKLKSEAYAKGGEIAKKDILVKAGPTDLLPGPVISEFARARIPAGVEKGRIAIKKDTMVVKKGETISPAIASILRKLKIKSVDVQLNVSGFLYNGKVIDKSTLNLVLEYPRLITVVYKNAFNLTINIGYPTKKNINMLLTIAYGKAKNLEKLVGGAN